MAATRKSTKRSKGKRAAGKKRGSAKRSSAKTRSAGKSASRKTTAKRRSRTGSARTPSLKRTARKGLQAAREGLDTVRLAGEKTWEVLRSTTAQVVEGVKDTIGREPEERREATGYRRDDERFR